MHVYFIFGELFWVAGVWGNLSKEFLNDCESHSSLLYPWSLIKIIYIYIFFKTPLHSLCRPPNLVKPFVLCYFNSLDPSPFLLDPYVRGFHQENMKQYLKKRKEKRNREIEDLLNFWINWNQWDIWYAYFPFQLTCLSCSLRCGSSFLPFFILVFKFHGS